MGKIGLHFPSHRLKAPCFSSKQLCSYRNTWLEFPEFWKFQTEFWAPDWIPGLGRENHSLWCQFFVVEHLSQELWDRISFGKRIYFHKFVFQKDGCFWKWGIENNPIMQHALTELQSDKRIKIITLDNIKHSSPFPLPNTWLKTTLILGRQQKATWNFCFIVQQ